MAKLKKSKTIKSSDMGMMDMMGMPMAKPIPKEKVVIAKSKKVAPNKSKVTTPKGKSKIKKGK